MQKVVATAADEAVISSAAVEVVVRVVADDAGGIVAPVGTQGLCPLEDHPFD